MPGQSGRASKIVCTACRTRKKRCDGDQPACSSCRKRHGICRYEPAGRRDRLIDPAPNNPLPAEFAPWPLAHDGGIFAAASAPAAAHQAQDRPSDNDPVAALLATDPWSFNQAAACSVDRLAPATGYFDTPFESQPQGLGFEGGDRAVDDVADTVITPEDQMHLVELFSVRLHSYIPLFPKEQPVFDVDSAHLSCPLLSLAMKALAASSHPAARIRALQASWYDEAKALYAETGYQPTQPLQTLQAAVCIILQALVMADHSTAWLCMGKAWRQAVALRFHQTDAAPGSGNIWPSRGNLEPTSPPEEPRELEQRRRTIWAMVLLDRSMCFLVGHAHAIDERQLCMNLPMSVAGAAAIPFTPRFRKLVSLVGMETHQGRADLCHYVLLAYMLLGRIAEHRSSLDIDPEDTEALLEELGQMRLMFPWFATSLSGANHNDFGRVVWLNALLAANTILLYHGRLLSRQCLTPEPEQQEPSGRNSEVDQNDVSWLFTNDNSMLPDQASEPIHGTEDGNTMSAQSHLSSISYRHPHWQHCLAAARDMVSLIREVTRVTTEPLVLNPNMGPLLFVCARILIIEYHLQIQAQRRDEDQSLQQKLRNDLAVLLTVFDRMTEAFDGVGQKFRGGVMYHLRLAPETGLILQDSGTTGYMMNCESWKEAGADKSVHNLLL